VLSSQGVNRDGKYFPYGQERPSATTDGKEKFATYFRDSETGLDYANHRYHQPGMGRFMTPDRMTGTPKDPGSWNKYAHTEGDPINGIDPEGLFAQQVQLGADTVTVDACSGAPDAATLWYLGFIGMTAWDVQQYCQGGSGGGTGFGSEPGGDGGGGGITPQ
jgi:RHS repeat-associated protein